MIKRLLLFALLLCVAIPAQAEDYTKPDWTNLLRTLIRFNAINISDDKTLDEYAAVSECDLYKAFYKDDFKWNQVRAAIRDSVRANVASFPTSYAYVTQLQLDRYSFEDKVFRLSTKTSLHNINALRIFGVQGEPCPNAQLKLVPATFRAVLDTPIYFDGIPLAPNDAQAILTQMQHDNNIDRIITAVFNIRVVYVAPMHISHIADDMRGYTQNGNEDNRTARLDVRLDSIDFYEDAAMSRLIYKLQP